VPSATPCPAVEASKARMEVRPAFAGAPSGHAERPAVVGGGDPARDEEQGPGHGARKVAIRRGLVREDSRGDGGSPKRYRAWYHLVVAKIRRGGYVFVTWVGDHPPRPVHVYRDGRLVVKWNSTGGRP